MISAGKTHQFLGDVLPSDFRAEIFRLVDAAWLRVKLPRSKRLEPRITGLLQHSVIAEQESLYGHTAPFFILEDTKRRDPKTGKEIDRSDLEFHLLAHRIRAQRAYFVFESKRLNISYGGAPDSNASEYVGDGGMGCLLSGSYNAISDYSGMLAYVMDGNVTEAKHAVERHIVRKSEELRIRGEAKIHPSEFVPKRSPHGETHHLNDAEEFKIFHIFLSVSS